NVPRFLALHQLYAPESPVILCEGETDNVYLTHAIRNLAVDFHDLAEVKHKKIRLKVRLYKYSRSSTARILGLRDGGSSALSKFIEYRTNTDHFTAPGLKWPVIILHDNDKGANAIRNAVHKVSQPRLLGREPYVHITRNLYAVPTPLCDGAQESKIED